MKEGPGPWGLGRGIKEGERKWASQLQYIAMQKSYWVYLKILLLHTTVSKVLIWPNMWIYICRLYIYITTLLWFFNRSAWSNQGISQLSTTFNDRETHQTVYKTYASMQDSRETPWQRLWQLILMVHSSATALSRVTWRRANMHVGGQWEGKESEAEICGCVASPQGKGMARPGWKLQNLVPSKVICCGRWGWVGRKFCTKNSGRSLNCEDDTWHPWHCCYLKWWLWESHKLACWGGPRVSGLVPAL